METNKILSSLSYFSVLFAGILFPLIVWLAAEDEEVKGHAKKAFFSHLIPLIPLPILLFSVFSEIIIEELTTTFPVIFFTSFVLMIILSCIVLVWNIVKGIKVLR
ncbi:hypothetical protein C0966_12215 [Bacillus methanolicus]|uniref:DUF4870 domain-containing protein n=1 Tax=Bacillus methanolicus TaxID=1471 RepID=UPI00237FFD39|nr:DUF4870 domain-containing protein [Bacillus methanolicus]MDE3840111.1 hypothetical protein [Bacillus methanolicus]